MAHFDEMTCLLYLEGQLDRERAAELSRHIDSCAECRTLLGALESESRLLRAALVEEEEILPARLREFAPEPAVREAAPLAWLATMGFAGAGAFTLWSWFINPSLQQLSQAGFGGSDFLSMMIFSGVFWKGWDSMVNLTEIFAAVTLVVIAVALFRRSWRHNSTMAVVLGLLGFLMIMPAPASAAEIRHEATGVTVTKDETVKNDLIAAGNSVKIEGTVEGDLIVFTRTLTVDGHVTGDIIAFAQVVRINGTVDGNVRSFSNTVSFGGTVAKNVTSFSENFELASNKEIQGSLTLFAAMASQDGRVGRDLLSFVGQHSLDGYVGGAANMRSDKLVIGPSTEMQGRVQIKTPHEPSISDRAKFGAGKPEITIEKRRPDYTKPGYYWKQTLRWGAAFVLGLVILLLMPVFLADSVRAGERIGLSLGVGVLTLIVTPVAAVIACITIVGLAVGLIGLVTWIAALYASQVFVGAFLGQKILGPAATTGALVGRLAIGLLIIRVVGMLPYAGQFAWLAVIIFGLGLVMLTIMKRVSPAQAPAAQ